MAQDPEWREFEKLVAMIEHHLGPRGVVIRSPDHIADKVTGQLREVDASIRYQVGSVPILITIECRDRVSTEDVTWIEQLISKRDSVGATATIAVSSTGFSSPAKEKAVAHGIETRILKDVSDEAIRDWAKHLQLVVVRGGFNVVRTSLKLKPIGGQDDPPPEPAVLSELAKGDVDYRFIRRVEEGVSIGIGDLLKESESKRPAEGVTLESPLTLTIPPMSSVKISLKSSFPSLFDDVTVDAPAKDLILKWDFEQGEASVTTIHGPAEIESLEVQVSVGLRSLPVNVWRLLSYEGADGQIAQVEQRQLDVGNGQVLRATSTSSNSGNKTA